MSRRKHLVAKCPSKFIVANFICVLYFLCDKQQITGCFLKQKTQFEAERHHETPPVALRGAICGRDQLSPQPASSCLSLISHTETRSPWKDPRWNVTSHETATAASLPPRFLSFYFVCIQRLETERIWGTIAARCEWLSQVLQWIPKICLLVMKKKKKIRKISWNLN